ncbi:MAG: nucleotidyltransferase domain-containing protein [Planctomycetota bacterium]
MAERFQLDKIILFGSHADGQPQADSDVDILVIMPARNQHDHDKLFARKAVLRFGLRRLVAAVVCGAASFARCAAGPRLK